MTGLLVGAIYNITDQVFIGPIVGLHYYTDMKAIAHAQPACFAAQVVSLVPSLSPTWIRPKIYKAAGLSQREPWLVSPCLCKISDAPPSVQVSRQGRFALAAGSGGDIHNRTGFSAQENAHPFG